MELIFHHFISWKYFTQRSVPWQVMLLNWTFIREPVEQILLNHHWTFSFPSGRMVYSYFIATVEGNDCRLSKGRVCFNPHFDLASCRCCFIFMGLYSLALAAKYCRLQERMMVNSISASVCLPCRPRVLCEDSEKCREKTSNQVACFCDCEVGCALPFVFQRVTSVLQVVIEDFLLGLWHGEMTWSVNMI